MAALTTSERDSLARMLGDRKKLLRAEMRPGLARMGNERVAPPGRMPTQTGIAATYRY